MSALHEFTGIAGSGTSLCEELVTQWWGKHPVCSDFKFAPLDWFHEVCGTSPGQDIKGPLRSQLKPQVTGNLQVQSLD